MHEVEADISFKNLFVPFTTLKAIHFLIFIGLIVYFNGLFNPFLGDDFLQIVNNSRVHIISNIGNFFFGSTFYNGNEKDLVGVYFKPFLLSAFSLIYSIFGANAFWYHLAQLFLHISNAVVLFLVFKHFFHKSTSFVLAILFLIHPINSQSVFYISALQEPLFFIFGITALWFVIKAKETNYLVIASILVLFSLFSKETGILFLLASLIYLVIFNRNILKQFLIIVAVPIFLYFVLRVNAVELAGNPHLTPIADLDLITRMLHIPVIIFYYLKTFIFPITLIWTHNWSYTSFDFTNFYLPLLIELLLLGTGAYFAQCIYKKSSSKYFHSFIFFTVLLIIGLSLHLQIIPLDMVASETWFYFPSIGILGIIGVVYETFKSKLNKNIILITVLVLITALSFRTIARSFDWRDEGTMNYKDLQANDDNYAAQANLALSLYEKGKLAEAKTLVEKSIKRYPRAASYNLLGAIYFEEGNYPKAKEAYINGLNRGGLQIQYETIAQLSVFYGKPDEYIKYIETGLQKYPNSANLWKFLAILEYKQGKFDEAKEHITRAYTLDSSSQMAQIYDAIIKREKLRLSPKNLSN